MSGDEFLTWGWRIPFFLSLILVAVGLYIRINILETPVFSKLLARRKIERAPTLRALQRHPKEIILSAFARMGEQAPFYVFTAFVFWRKVKVTALSTTRMADRMGHLLLARRRLSRGPCRLLLVFLPTSSKPT